MLDLAFAVLLLAGSIGAVLAMLFLREGATPEQPPPFRLGAGVALLHGAIGAAGLVLLVIAISEGAIQPSVGLGGFPAIAAWLFGLALLAGLVLLAVSAGDAEATPRGRRAILIAIHAFLAISGLVVLLALVGLG